LVNWAVYFGTLNHPEPKLAVTKNQVPAAALPDPQPVEPQSIALELARVKRWMIIGDNRVYEAGVVYDFDADFAQRLMRKTDDAGFPIWVRERPRKPAQPRAPDPVLDAESRHAYRERVMVRRPSQGVSGSTPTAVAKTGPAAPIEIPDDDPELAARLGAIDGEPADTTKGAVSV
jgi:hypothetical protein